MAQDDGFQSICHQMFVSKKKTAGRIVMAFRDTYFISFEADFSPWKLMAIAAGEVATNGNALGGYAWDMVKDDTAWSNWGHIRGSPPFGLFFQTDMRIYLANNRSLIAAKCPERRQMAVASASSPRHQAQDATPAMSKRAMLTLSAGILMATCEPAAALDKKEIARRRKKVAEEDFTNGPQGLKFYDIVEGAGAEAQVGARVAVHYDVKYRNVTFITSRQGMGVTGGTPVGFNVGTKDGEPGSTLPGIDLGVRGMRIGGLRRLIVPPNLAYGKNGIGEIPGDATLNIDVELLSIKTSPFGSRVKLVEG